MAQQHFKTKAGHSAWLDSTQVRSIIGQGDTTKVVLDGGHAVTVEGDVHAVRGSLRAAEAGGIRSVSCDASGAPDFYLTLDESGTPFLDGRKLDDVAEADVRAWATEAVRRFLSTGERAKVPGKAA